MGKRKTYKFHWYGSHAKAENARQAIIKNRKTATAKNLKVTSGTIGNKPAYALTATSKRSVDIARNYLKKNPGLKHK